MTRTRGTPSAVRRRTFLASTAALGAGAVAGCLGDNEPAEAEASAATAALLEDATLYKSPNCACCDEYAAYLQSNADASIEIEAVTDLAAVKDEHGIPGDVGSCHTVDAGEYFVEGHVPLEGIDRLTAETPDVAGVALPEMPPGSPGMGGEKRAEFVLYAVREDGSFEEYARL